MSHMKPKYLPTAVAGAVLAAYTAVKFSSGNIETAGAGEGIGVVQGDYQSGDSCEVAVGGGLGLLGGTVTAGQFLKSDADGHLVACDTDKDQYVAVALADGVDGDVISIDAGVGFYAA